MRLFRLIASSLLLGAVVGCNTSPQMRYDSVQLVEASGTVTLDGKPLPNAVVTFESPETGQFAYGMTDSDGYYTLQFDSAVDGVTPGRKIVRISTTRKILGLNSEEEAGEGGGEGEGAAAAAPEKELVPAKYNKSSELTVEVTPDQTEYDFELSST